MADDESPAPGALLLVDGHSLAYRAFFALPEDIATSAGQPTNALYGLASMMMKVVTETRPGRVVVCWDAPGKVFRHEQFPEYKAGRRDTPDLFREQSPHFQPLMERFGFTNTSLEGFEADDVIGTLARQAEAAGEDVVILTGDRDAFQLASDRIAIMATGRGVTDTKLYTPAVVEGRYGIGPALMTDFRGMVGDPSDNLPGVPGIGEKTATQLLHTYGDLETILANADEQTPKRRENLTNHADDARMTRDLAVIDVAAPVELDLADVPPLVVDEDLLGGLAELFRELEFTSLARRLSELSVDGLEISAAAAGLSLREVETEEAVAQDLGMRLAGGTPVTLAVVEGRWAILMDDGPVLTGSWDEAAPAAISAALAGCPLTCHDAKSLPLAILEATGVPAHDTMIAAYLLEPRRRGEYPLDELAESAGIAAEGTEDPAALAAALTHDLAALQRTKLDETGTTTLLHEIELPIVPVLAAMEHRGITLDIARLGEIAAKVREGADELRDQIYEHAGGEFTIESPKQLGEVLFERLGLPTFRKGKTGWSTDRQVLRRLEDKHPIVPLVGRYRELVKLDNTYLSALPDLVDEEGRIHTTFAQTVAETGRLSSRDPNLQNIPVRTPLGREIRDAFAAPRGRVLVSCDYSQVELRILAHCSGEPTLREAFRRGEDVHTATAAEVFGMAPADVDRETRDRAKAVNFGIVYGISDFGLSEQLGISREDAGNYIETYLDRYPKIREFIDQTIADATETGRVTTLLGRRRPIPELGARTRQQRQLGERLAVNTVIQGTAADIIKLAMTRAHAALRESDLDADLVLQIHDELLIEADEDDAVQTGQVVSAAMVGAYTLDPALSVDVGSGITWMSAKS